MPCTDRAVRFWSIAAVCTILTTAVQAQTKPTIGQFLSPGMPLELVSARDVDRIAWVAYEEGHRNIYTAAAPAFRPVRLTRFLEDDGVVLTNLTISADGRTVAFIRGSAPNRDGWVADPASNPTGSERAIWAARTDGTGAWRLGEGGPPVLSPDGRAVLFTKDGQIYRYDVAARSAAPATASAEKPWIRLWGRNGNPVWSPDGSKVALVSDRVDHSFIAVYDLKTRKVTYLAPSVDRDGSPTWSADSKRIAFIRRPGLAFGQQAHGGTGSLGNPSGPAAARGARSGESADARPGLMQAAFTGGYVLSFWVADAATGEGQEFWHHEPGDSAFATIRSIRWAGDHVVFQAEPGEWIRAYAVSVDKGGTPVELSPGEGMLETSALSSDGRTLFYGSNVGDIDRRHVWKVATEGGSATQLTTGNEIELSPAPLASGAVAVLTASATRPLSVGIVPANGGAARVIYPTLRKEFPTAAHVVPENVVLRAEDGLEFHNQLFLPKDYQPGERRPAIIFVHGGPVRQMLLGYHYMDFYHISYAANQWLASLGYVVMSVNYRLGIGYGKSFRNAPKSGARGNAEYLDVVAAAKYLQGRPDVDPGRVGIWGLSYGGVLTAQALARNSDIFAAGVDMAGVHLWGNSLAPNDVSYQSSAIAAVDKWTSPVLLWHGDDDRNVQFSQTTGLVQLLRAHRVPFELIVLPDDTHETLIHQRWIYTFDRIQDFLTRNLWNRQAGAGR
ncbi:MAG: S9 family peptidase [Gemmatimonadales bacterium]